MPTKRRKQQIADALRRLALTHAANIRQFEEVLAILKHEFDLLDVDRGHEGVSGIHVPPEGTCGDDVPHADRLTLSVRWHGRTCFLGNTLLFRFFEKLAARPDRYCPHEELLDEVWGGPRSKVSIRNVAKRLRDKLSHSGLAGVARAIDGSVRGHYSLRMERIEK